jgi:hypothetical protein
MAENFAATVDAWTAATKQRMLAVRNHSIERVVEVMQTPVGAGGNMPVDTGFLRSSLQFTMGEANYMLRENPNPDAAKGSLDSFSTEALITVLLGADLGDAIEAVYTAAYARRLEYGFQGADSLGRVYNQAGRRFVGLAAQQWPKIVEDAIAEAKASVASRQR